MGAHSTLKITRKCAKAYIIDKVTNGMSDKELELIMDDLLYDNLYNCTIVPDDWESSNLNDNAVL